MSIAATRMDPCVTPEMAELLRAGTTDQLGLICRPGQVQKNYPALRAAEKLGYLRFLDVYRPWITPEGRAAIGAPTEAAADRARAMLLLATVRKPLVPAKRDDPRSDFDYRSYKSMGYVCTLVIRQPDPRDDPKTVRVGRSLTSEPQYLGPRNAILQPESEGRFVLALVPGWMVRPINQSQLSCRLPAFSSCPMPLDESDESFTDEERELWERLRRICSSINSRIRNANRRQPDKLRFGEFA